MKNAVYWGKYLSYLQKMQASKLVIMGKKECS